MQHGQHGFLPPCVFCLVALHQTKSYESLAARLPGSQRSASLVLWWRDGQQLYLARVARAIDKTVGDLISCPLLLL